MQRFINYTLTVLACLLCAGELNAAQLYPEFNCRPTPNCEQDEQCTLPYLNLPQPAYLENLADIYYDMYVDGDQVHQPLDLNYKNNIRSVKLGADESITFWKYAQRNVGGQTSGREVLNGRVLGPGCHNLTRLSRQVGSLQLSRTTHQTTFYADDGCPEDPPCASQEACLATYFSIDRPLSWTALNRIKFPVIDSKTRKAKVRKFNWHERILSIKLGGWERVTAWYQRNNKWRRRRFDARHLGTACLDADILPQNISALSVESANTPDYLYPAGGATFYLEHDCPQDFACETDRQCLQQAFAKPAGSAIKDLTEVSLKIVVAPGKKPENIKLNYDRRISSVSLAPNAILYLFSGQDFPEALREAIVPSKMKNGCYDLWHDYQAPYWRGHSMNNRARSLKIIKGIPQ